MKHIDFAKLIDKFEGKLDAAEDHEIAGHLSSCGDCQTEFQKLAVFFAVTSDAWLESVPQAVTARILNIYQRKPKSEPLAEPKRNWLSSLVFDDWQTAVSERYSGLDSRQMLFRVDNYDIDLRIDLTDDKCRIAGQVFPEIPGATVELIAGGETTSATINDFGEFTFDAIPHGIYDIRISDGSVDLLIEQVPLQH